jgi:hypothetical protein
MSSQDPLRSQSRAQFHVCKQGSRTTQAGVVSANFCLALCLAMLAAEPLAGAAQQAAPSQPQAPQSQTQSQPAQDQKTESSKTEDQQAQTTPAAEPAKPSSDPVQRRKDQIAADTAKLDQLANELKAEMDKSTKDTLSLNVIKKANEIEKLAHKLRDEISASLVN